MLVLCGRDDPALAGEPNADQIQAQIGQLQAQKQVVLDHQAWLQAQQTRKRETPRAWPRVRPSTSTKSPSQTPTSRKTP